MSLNCIASSTVSVSAVAVIGAAVALTAVESTITMVALGALMAVGSCLAIAGASAWCALTGQEEEVSAKEYFSKIGEHLVGIVPMLLTIVGQAFCRAAVSRAADAVGDNIYDKLRSR